MDISVNGGGKPTKILVYGGGGPIAAPVAQAAALARDAGENVEVSILAREGVTFNQLRDVGLTVQYRPEAGNRKTKKKKDTDIIIPVPTVELITPDKYTMFNNSKEGGQIINGKTGATQHEPVDFIFLGLKATEVTIDKLDELAASGLLGPDTKIITLQNGVPIWLGLTNEAKAKGIDYVDAVDPGGKITRKYGKHFIAGFTAAAARQVKVDDKVVPASSHVSGDYSYFFGPADGADSADMPRVMELVRILNKGGLNAQARGDMGLQAVLKLLGNTPLNAISALKNARLSEIAQTPELRAYALEVMKEVQAIAVKLGIKGAAELDLDHRLDAAGTLTHYPSMHGDTHGGKMPEIAALIGGVIELGRKLNVATPATQALHNEMSLLARSKLNGAFVEQPTRPSNVTRLGAIGRYQRSLRSLPQAKAA